MFRFVICKHEELGLSLLILKELRTDLRSPKRTGFIFYGVTIHQWVNEHVSVNDCFTNEIEHGNSQVANRMVFFYYFCSIFFLSFFSIVLFLNFSFDRVALINNSGHRKITGRWSDLLDIGCISFVVCLMKVPYNVIQCLFRGYSVI